MCVRVCVRARVPAVPEYLVPLIAACQKGNLDRVKELWLPEQLPALNALSKEECCHPLLCATHHLHLDVVRFLCEAVRWARGAPLSPTASSAHASCAPDARRALSCALIAVLLLYRACPPSGPARCTRTPATA